MKSERAPHGDRADAQRRGGEGSERSRAYEASLRLLAARARSRAELADRLQRKGYPEAVVGPLLDDLERAGLIDDADFAAQWVYFRHRDGGRSRRALGMELRSKGVDGAVIEEAVAQISDDDECARATELVRRTLRRRRPAAGSDAERREQRRLVGMLARKGYGSELAYTVVMDEWRAVAAERAAAGD
ncbi:regulatory protein RecX [Tomitella fengzijianii]|uniref:Regulatory protein RecX n=1 Tax=Tomitella fengzijianii TaxID=2597660 RepID=A0A516X4Q2_9ACTN|nr:regulatory protein RecX [Tomitella fengzijianii]QDQ97641.1 regulatory protein RecX [Tomitella fengzijianii]